MKFDGGSTWAERIEAKSKWRRWFAWRPVRIASHDCRWLETIERRGERRCWGHDIVWVWEYRSIK